MSAHSLVIGGTKGLGRATVQILADQDHTVSVFSRNSPADSGPPGVSYWRTDLTNPTALGPILAEAVAQNGAIANLVFFQRYRGEGDDWDGEVETTLTGTKNMIDLAVPHFPTTGGSIVLISSVNAELISKHLSVGYHVGKAGMRQLARYYAVQLGSRGIRVNCLSPGTLLKSESSDFFLKNEELMRVYQAMVPLARLGEAEELGKTVAFLCSDGSSYITGQDIAVDGGLSLLWQEALVRQIIGK